MRGGRDSDSDREADAPGTPAFSPELAVEETMSVCYCLANALQVRPIQPLSSPYLAPIYDLSSPYLESV